MSADLPTTPDLRAAVRTHRVFSQLGAAAQAALCEQLQLETAEPGSCLADGAALADRLGWLLAGSAALQCRQPACHVPLQAGDLFGCGAAPHADLQHWLALAQGQVHLAWLPAAALVALRTAHPALQALLAPPHRVHAPELPDRPELSKPPELSDRPDPGNADAASAGARLNLLTMPVSALCKRAPVTLPPSASIRAAAERMQDQRVSSLLVVEDGRLLGIVTDRDLRNRVLAQGLDTARPVLDITTLAPLGVQLHAPGFDALLLMARHNIHHVPVHDGDQLVGMVTASDLTEQHSSSAVYLVGSIHKQTDLAGLVAASARLRPLQRQLAAAQASAYVTGHIVTAVTDAITIRLLQLAEARLGPPPVAYAWVAAGSQARNEQTAHSDQDNCMVLDDAL